MDGAEERSLEERLQNEEAEAWFDYLDATRNQSEERYAEVEPLAFANLNQRIRSIKKRRAKLSPQTA